MAIAYSSTPVVAPLLLFRTKPSSPSSYHYYCLAPSASLASRASPLLSGGGGGGGLLRPVERRRRSGGRGGGGGALGSRCLFGLGVPELVVIAGVAALVFGPKKLPEIGRSIGKTVKSFQQLLLKHSASVLELLYSSSLVRMLFYKMGIKEITISK